MRVLNLEPRPLHRICYTNAAKRGATVTAFLPVHRAHVDALPSGTPALLLTSDLQGVVGSSELGGETRLLGEELARVAPEIAAEHGLPAPEASGAILAGDLYSAPDGSERGASGDVRSVWNAFAETFSWVAGVAGNHDRFGSERERQQFEKRAGVHLLDCDVVMLGGFRIGGVGNIIGDSARPGRCQQEDFLAALELVLQRKPDVVVLHEGPVGDRTQRGSDAIKALLLRHPPTLVICGHRHWDTALHALHNGGQVLNVDARAVVLTQ